MINAISLRKLQAFFLVLCLLTLSACGLTPVDAMVRGSKSLTAEGYLERYAGNSIAFGDKKGDPVTTEIYFGKDGSYYDVELDREVISYGTWSVNSALGANLVFNVTTAGIVHGKPYRHRPSFMTLYTYVLPDGTASTFSRTPSGPHLYSEPKPTPGFQARARFDALKRKIDAALGS